MALKQDNTLPVIVFVCTGNTCRSPMAAALAQKHLQARGLPAVVTSAGTAALEGDQASREARRVMAEIDLSLEDHRARRLAKEDLLAADLVLTMTGAQRERAALLAPGTAHKLFTLSFYAGQDGDIADPYGQGAQVYRLCREQLDVLVARSIERFLAQRNLFDPSGRDCD